MAWYWYLVPILMACVIWFIKHCKKNIKEQARVDAGIRWKFAVGNLNIFRNDTVILDHQLGCKLSDSDAYELLLKRHGRARCLWCYQRTEAVIPEKSLTYRGFMHRSLACNKCGCFILNDIVGHMFIKRR